MPIFSKEDSQFLFVHIPKTAGSAIENHFADLGWTTYFLDRSDAFQFGSSNYWRRVSPQHMHKQLIIETLDLSRFDLIFTVMRNPIDRMRSEFAWRHPGFLDEVFTEKQVEDWWFYHKEVFRRDPFHLDNHFRPQTDFILPKAKVFRFEADLDSVGALALGSGSSGRMKGAKPKSMPSVNRSWNHIQEVPLSSRLTRELTRFYKEDFKYLKKHISGKIE